MERLDLGNINSYVLKEYSNRTIYRKDTHQIVMEGFLQKDYGELEDCAITSMATNLYYFDHEKQNFSHYYKIVEILARKAGYNGKTYGMFSFTIKGVYTKAAAQVFPDMKPPYHPSNHVFKNIGYNFKGLKQILDSNIPIILALWKDGRDYYKDHVVVVCGYLSYITSTGETINFLLIKDNWNKNISIIDYQKLSTISNAIY